MPVRSKWGGLATLQRAIVLDSLGRHREAEALYKSLQAHPSGSVAKKAKNMLFGFEAMAFMKADTMSYIRTTKEFDPFFRRFSDANQVRGARGEGGREGE